MSSGMGTSYFRKLNKDFGSKFTESNDFVSAQSRMYRGPREDPTHYSVITDLTRQVC